MGAVVFVPNVGVMVGWYVVAGDFVVPLLMIVGLMVGLFVEISFLDGFAVGIGKGAAVGGIEGVFFVSVGVLVVMDMEKSIIDMEVSQPVDSK